MTDKTILHQFRVLRIAGWSVLPGLLCGFVVYAMVLLNEAAERTASFADNTGARLVELQKRADGTFQNVNDLLIQASLTADAVRRTAIDERIKISELSDSTIAVVNNLGDVAKQGSVAIQDFQGIAESLKTDSDSLGKTIDGATVLLGTLDTGSKGALDRATEAIGNVNGLVVAASPIPRNLSATSEEMRHGVGELDQIATDAAGYVHALVHPKKAGFWREWFTALLGPTFRVIVDHVWPLTVQVKH